MTTPSQPPSFGAPPPLPASAPRPRPATVTAAAGLLFLSVLLGVVGVIISIANKDIAIEIAKKNAAKTAGAPDPTAFVNLSTYGSGACELVVFVALAVLGVLVLRGNNVARITTWVLCGLSLLCLTGVSLASVLGPNSADVPGWYAAYGVISAGVGLVVNVAIIVLLALRPSNEFFAKPVAR
jgi:hypothetical protein